MPRSAALIFSGILLSRVLGLVRTTLFARYLGAGPEADAYNSAFKIPNVLRNVLGEGTLSAAFVPVYSRMLARSEAREARTLAMALLGILLAIVSMLTLVGIAAAPWLVAVLVPGFDAERQRLTAQLVRVLFPMTALMVVSGWCLGVQNAHRRFFWAYASAALWSVAQIVLLVWRGPRAPDLTSLAVWLAWATLVGAVLQVGAQLPEVRRLLGPLRPTLDTRAAGVTATARNVVPTLGGLGVVQLSSVIDGQIASFLPAGAPSHLSFASLLTLLPVSLFGVSIAAAALPEFSRQTAEARVDRLRDDLRGGWQRLVFYLVPSAAALLAFGDLCAALLFRGGAFTASDQTQVARILAASSLGLLAFASIKLFASAHYALADYRTPLRGALLSLMLSAAIAMTLAWMFRTSGWATAGIAFGSAIGAIANLALQWRSLHRALGALMTPAMWMATRRSVISVTIGVALAWPLRWVTRSWSPMVQGVPSLCALGLVYLLVSWWLGSGEAARLLRVPRRGASHA